MQEGDEGAGSDDQLGGYCQLNLSGNSGSDKWQDQDQYVGQQNLLLCTGLFLSSTTSQLINLIWRLNPPRLFIICCLLIGNSEPEQDAFCKNLSERSTFRSETVTITKIEQDANRKKMMVSSLTKIESVGRSLCNFSSMPARPLEF